MMSLLIQMPGSFFGLILQLTRSSEQISMEPTARSSLGTWITTRSLGCQLGILCTRHTQSGWSMIQREESWCLTDSQCLGRIISTLLRVRMAVNRRCSMSCTQRSQRLMRNGESSVYQSPRTLSKAESHCLKHGEVSETRSWMRSLESAVATSPSREPRLWLSRRLIFEYGLGMHCRRWG